MRHDNRSTSLKRHIAILLRDMDEQPEVRKVRTQEQLSELLGSTPLELRRLTGQLGHELRRPRTGVHA